MHIIPAERWAQIKAFNGLQEAAREVLSEPEVQSRLGGRAVQLADINENLFLPDVRDGVVTIPAKKMETDHVALLPVTGIINNEHYQTYAADESVLHPTPSKRERVIRRIAQFGFGEHEAEKFIQGTIAEHTYPVDIDCEDDPHAFIFQGNDRHAPTGTLVTSRPLIVAGGDIHDMFTVETGMVMVHEYSHVIDFEERIVKPEDILAAMVETELRAYRTESLAARGLEKAGWDFRKSDIVRLSRDIERIRRQHASPGNPYRVTPQIVREFVARKLFDQEYVDSLHKKGLTQLDLAA